MTARAKKPDFGPYPQLVDLPVDRLFPDEAYQRDMASKRSRKLVEKIAAEFFWPKFGVVIATPWPEKDGWAIIDGQHRSAAARLAGIGKVPALVYDGLTTAQAAAVFTGVNNDRVSVHPMGMHHAMLAAGDPGALAIDRVCRAAGVEITRYPVQASNMKPGQTMAVAAIRRAIKRHDEHVATRALRLLAEAFARRAGHIRANLILGVSMWVAQSRTSAKADLPVPLGEAALAWLRETNPADLSVDIAAHREVYGDSAPAAVAAMLSGHCGQDTGPRRAMPGARAG